MLDLLPLLTISSSEVRDIEMASAGAKNSLLEFNRLLNVYRRHEARYDLLEKLQSKIDEAAVVETQLKQ